MRITGGCLCGAIRFELSTDPLLGIACHCRACQYIAGGSPAVVAAFPRAALTITRGVPRTYWSAADSGANTGRSFCEICGTPLFAENDRNDDFIAIKVGSLDDSSAFRVQMDVWRCAAQSWHKSHEGALQFQKNPQ